MASLELDGRPVLITGGSGNLGWVVTRSFLEAGADVCISYRNQARADALRSDLGPLADRLVAVRADLLSSGDAQRLVRTILDRWNGLWAVINLVGGFRSAHPMWSADTAHLDFLLDANLRTVANVCTAALPHMVASRGGRLVNVSAKVALSGMKGLAAYSASKAALVAMTLSLAEELRGSGVTANVILPGIIDTPANRASMPTADRSSWTSPQHIADLLLFLASPLSSGITGAAIPI